MIDFDLFPDVEYNGTKYSADIINKICPLASVLKTNNYSGKYLFIAPASYGKTTNEESTKIHLIKEKKIFVYIDLFDATRSKEMFNTNEYDVPKDSIALIDSLDEVYKENRKKAEDIISKIEKDTRFSCIVVASRFEPGKNSDGFSPKFLKDFETISILDFEHDKIHKLAQICRIHESSFVYNELLKNPMYASIAIMISQNEKVPETIFNSVQDEVDLIELYLKKLLEKKDKEKTVESLFDFKSSDIFKCAFDTVRKNPCFFEAGEKLIPKAFNTIYRQEYQKDNTFYLRGSSLKFINYAAAKHIINTIIAWKKYRSFNLENIKDLLDFSIETDNYEVFKFAGELLKKLTDNKDILTSLNKFKDDSDWYFNLTLIILSYFEYNIVDLDGECIWNVGDCFFNMLLNRLSFNERYVLILAIESSYNIYANEQFQEYGAALDKIPKSNLIKMIARGVTACLNVNSSQYILRTEFKKTIYWGSKHNPYLCCVGTTEDNEDGICYIARDCKLVDAEKIIAVTKYVVEKGNQLYRSKQGVLFDKMGLTLIKCPAFLNKKIYYIPQGVKRIENNSFFASDTLETVYCPASLEEIGERAFGYSKMQTVVLNNKIKVLPSYVFEHSTISKIRIPNGVEKIDFAAFSGCKELSKISIPETVSSIEAFAFEGCESLVYVRLPDKVNSLNGYTFSGCRNLKLLKLSDLLFDFWDCEFEGCDNLEFLHIPTSCPAFYGRTFAGCDSLRELRFETDLISLRGKSLDDLGLNANCKIIIPKEHETSKQNDYSTAHFTKNTENSCSSESEDYESFLNSEILKALEDIDYELGDFDYKNDNDFDESTYNNVCLCNNERLALKPIERKYCIVDGVVYNEEQDILLQYKEDDRENFIVPDCVKIIGESAFYNSYNIRNVILSNSTFMIDSGAFCDCSRLDTIVIPKGMFFINDCAFEYCDELSTVFYCGDEGEWNEIEISPHYNDALIKAKRYYYAPKLPKTLGDYWHYVNGVPTVWE